MMEKRFVLGGFLLIATLVGITLVQGLFGYSLFKSNYEYSIALGGEWFLNTENAEFLHYEYNYREDGYSPEHHSLREMGSLWAIAVLGNYLNDQRYTVLASKGLDYFKKSLVEDQQETMMYSAITPTKSKLGYNAFLILTMLEIKDSADKKVSKDLLLQKLANGMIYQQNDDGSFRTFFDSDLSGGVDYYPGQALFALMKLYQYEQEPRYLEAVEKAFPYYVNYRASNANSAFVPWQTKAFFEYYTLTKNPAVAEYIFSMNDYYINNHNKREVCSEFIFNDGITTAIKIESVTQAYKLAKVLQDKERATCYANFVQEASQYVYKLQLLNQGPYSFRAVGGFRMDKASSIMRIDNNQHGIMAFIGAREAGLLE